MLGLSTFAKDRVCLPLLLVTTVMLAQFLARVSIDPDLGSKLGGLLGL